MCSRRVHIKQSHPKYSLDFPAKPHASNSYILGCSAASKHKTRTEWFVISKCINISLGPSSFVVARDLRGQVRLSSNFTCESTCSSYANVCQNLCNDLKTCLHWSKPALHMVQMVAPYERSEVEVEKCRVCKCH